MESVSVLPIYHMEGLIVEALCPYDINALIDATKVKSMFRLVNYLTHCSKTRSVYFDSRMSILRYAASEATNELSVEQKDMSYTMMVGGKELVWHTLPIDLSEFGAIKHDGPLIYTLDPLTNNDKTRFVFIHDGVDLVLRHVASKDKLIDISAQLTLFDRRVADIIDYIPITKDYTYHVGFPSDAAHNYLFEVPADKRISVINALIDAAKTIVSKYV